VNLQTIRSFDKVKQDMLWVPKTAHAQQCCALKGKMKVKEIANKIMMKDIMGVRRQRFLGIAMSAFFYQNLKLTSMVGER
jgi:hypothetical protein